MVQHLQQTQHELSGSDFGTMQEFIATLGRRGEPVAVMLTCSELGHIPDYVAHAGRGEIVIVQNPAGIVPPYNEDEPASAAGSISYGLSFPAVRHLIVCGHRGCHIVPLLLDHRRTDLFTEFREIVGELRNELNDLRNEVDDEEWQDLAVQMVILQQLEQLKSYPEICERLNDGDLQLHGWFCDDESAIISTYEPTTGQFSP